MRTIEEIISSDEFEADEFIFVATYEFDCRDDYEYELCRKATEWLTRNSKLFPELEDDSDFYEVGYVVEGTTVVTGRFNGYCVYSIAEINHMNDSIYQWGE